MSKTELNEELQSIVSAVKNAESGIKIGKIAEVLPKSISRRTLLRRLSELQKIGVIISNGTKNSTRYSIKSIEEPLQLSKTSQALKTYVHQPLQQRKPTAYNPDFLYSYQPNKTFYLSEIMRQHLRKTGKQFEHEADHGTYVKRILHRLLIDLSWNSSRLEGNTYSLLETKRLLEYGAVADEKQAFEAQMIINHKEAIEFIVEHINQLDSNQHTALNIHALLSNNLLTDPKARGRLRQIPVGISKTVYHPPEIPQLIIEYFDHIFSTAKKINDPFEQALFFMVQLPYLQPFEDVNKRVSRIVANIPLIKNNLSPLSFIDVPKDDYISGLLAIYELNKIELMRDVFIWAYERSALQYKVVRDTLVTPNLVHMRFKKELLELVNLIISNNIRGKEIIRTIQQWTQTNITKTYQEQFAWLAEKEIASLHDGNIAIYHIEPEVFAKWRIK